MPHQAVFFTSEIHTSGFVTKPATITEVADGDLAGTLFGHRQEER